MSFQGPDPYGTPGGTEIVIKAQSPEDVRIAQGRSYIIFLRVNGPITERFRENVEDVVRILGLSGLPLVAIIVRENGVVRDANASDVDYAAPLTATQIAPGVVVIDVAAGGITTTEIANAAVTLAKLATNSVDSSKIVDGSIVDIDINAAANIAGSKIANGSIAATKLASGALDWVLVGSADPAGASTAIIDGCFSATYKKYRIEYFLDGTTTAILRLILRNAGVDLVAAAYSSSGLSSNTGATFALSDVNLSTGWNLLGSAAWVIMTGVVEIQNPIAVDETMMEFYGGAIVASNAYQATFHGHYNAVAAANGLKISVTAGLMTGSIRVYALKET